MIGPKEAGSGLTQIITRVTRFAEKGKNISMFQRLVSKCFMTGMVVLACSTNGVAQDDQPAGGIGMQPATISEPMDESSMIQQASKIFGYNAVGRMATALEQQGLDLDAESVLAGAKMALEKKELDIAKEDVQAIMTSLQSQMQEKAVEKMKVSADQNKAAGEAFLAENEKKEGVKKLDNGVQYTVLTEGTGPVPAPTDKVKLHYHGTKTDGVVFDSSVQRGEPITHSASGFVKGFNAAVQAMPVGSKWEVVIPSDLAYGMEGPLGPNQTLIFEIELLEIVK